MTIEERAPFSLLVDGVEEQISTLGELQDRLAALRPDPYAELFLTDRTDQTLAVLINADRGWLMYLRYDGDAGLSSRNPSYTGPRDVEIPFELSNGEQNEYPVAWTWPTDVALQAFEYFFIHGVPSPAITWHDDDRDDSE